MQERVCRGLVIRDEVMRILKLTREPIAGDVTVVTPTSTDQMAFPISTEKKIIGAKENDWNNFTVILIIQFCIKKHFTFLLYLDDYL